MKEPPNSSSSSGWAGRWGRGGGSGAGAAAGGASAPLAAWDIAASRAYRARPATVSVSDLRSSSMRVSRTRRSSSLIPVLQIAQYVRLARMGVDDHDLGDPRLDRPYRVQGGEACRHEGRSEVVREHAVRHPR